MHHSKTAISEKPSAFAGIGPGHVLAAAFALVSCMSAASDPTCDASSPDKRVALLELYTSEGCSSCPPADRWLSNLTAAGFDADRVVPLAFHVDYWDALGWPDRFARAQFSARQRLQANRHNASFVYTPQFLLNGADYRAAFSSAGLTRSLAEINTRSSAAELRLAQRPSAAGIVVNLQVRVLDASAETSAEVHLAVTENNLDSEVRAGENSGKRLKHDFVVREFVGPLRLDAEGRLLWTKDIVLGRDWKRPDLSFVVFVQDARRGDVLQALRTPLCDRR